MTHISSLLEAVAPQPTRPFDADTFVRRALLRRRQRFLRWLGAVLVGGVAVGVPTQLALSPAGEGGLDVATVSPTTTTLMVDPDEAAPSGGPTGVGQPGGSRSNPQDRAASPGGAPGHRASSSGAPGGGGDAASTEGCRVYSQPSSQGGGPVEDPGENESVSTCEYRATRAAGYSGSGSWTLEIVRDGETFTYDSVTSPACAAVGVVRPGDFVRARLGLPGTQSTPVRASAGDGQWHLDVSPTTSC